MPQPQGRDEERAVNDLWVLLAPVRDLNHIQI